MTPQITNITQLNSIVVDTHPEPTAIMSVQTRQCTLLLKSWKCIYTNAQSLRNKLIELRSISAQYSPQLIAVTETWFSSDIRDCEVAIQGMTLLRRDREGGRGGGVALYLPETETVSVLDSAPWTDLPESLWCTIRPDRSSLCLLGIVYRAPNSSSHADEALLRILSTIGNSKFNSVLIMGDFNLPTLNFQSQELPHSLTSYATRFYQATVEHGLTEHVLADTWWRSDSQSSRLDLIFTNESLMVANVQRNAPLGRSDHALISFEYICCSSWKIDQPGTTRAFHKADFSAIRKDLAEADWVQPATVDEHWHHILRIVMRSIEVHIPLKRSGHKKQRNWLRRSTHKLLNSKRNAWETQLRTRSAASWSDYVTLRNKCNTAVRRDKILFQRDLAQKVKTNPKSFFTYLSSISKAKPGIPAISTLNGMTTSNKQAAEALAHQFASIYRTNVTGQAATTRVVPIVREHQCNLIITHEALLKKLSHLDVNKSIGPDGIHPLFLKTCALELATPLHALFQQSLDTGVVPTAWKHAAVTAIYKGGDRSKACNYRPIALLSIVSKVLESLIDDHLRNHLARTNFFAKQQHGFRTGHSCTTNLLLAQDSWTQAIDVGLGIDVIYLDFAKAFDSVDHRILIRKVEASGDILQHILHRIYDWTVLNCLPLNVDKCTVLHINQKDPKEYHINGRRLLSSTSQRDLGTIIAQDLSNSPNAAVLARKANSMAYLVRRNLGSIHPNYFPPIFCSLIRPHLEHKEGSGVRARNCLAESPRDPERLNDELDERSEKRLTERPDERLDDLDRLSAISRFNDSIASANSSRETEEFEIRAFWSSCRIAAISVKDLAEDAANSACTASGSLRNHNSCSKVSETPYVEPLDCISLSRTDGFRSPNCIGLSSSSNLAVFDGSASLRTNALRASYFPLLGGFSNTLWAAISIGRDRRGTSASPSISNSPVIIHSFSSLPDIPSAILEERSAPSKCKVCRLRVTNTQRGLACGICHHWVHLKCDDTICGNLYKCLVKYSADGLLYICPECKSMCTKHACGSYVLPKPNEPISPQWADRRAHKRQCLEVSQEPQTQTITKKPQTAEFETQTQTITNKPKTAEAETQTIELHTATLPTTQASTSFDPTLGAKLSKRSEKKRNRQPATSVSDNTLNAVRLVTTPAKSLHKPGRPIKDMRATPGPLTSTLPTSTDVATSNPGTTNVNRPHGPPHQGLTSGLTYCGAVTNDLSSETVAPYRAGNS
ncbi:hypothetical protein B566_EDAN019185, partial [Ephemera danica]